jgi:tetratricopeptide (TPR) repeat protein/transcriptional regulator with XRE-family HTH domain
MSFVEYTFSELLRQFRVHEHLSQHELAKRMGVHRNTIVAWEQGSHLPKTRPRVLELAQALHLNEQDTEYLFQASFLSTSTSITLSQSAQLWNVPYRRNPFFTGRDELLQLIERHLSTTGQEEVTTRRAALTQPQAIKGLGGIGKTQIAVEYAYRAHEQGQYTHTLWMNAASKEALMTSFTALAELLPEFPAKNETDQQKLVEAIKRWLEQCPERWFLIFDNADDLSLVQEYFPHHGNGSILLTTRANAVGSLATSIEVEKMGFIEGTHLLLRRAQRFAEASDEEINEAGNIVVALDHFPLALEQAGAYIEETGCSFGNYLQLYQTQSKALLNRRGTQTTNYPDPVATTWSLSFQKVEQANPAAAELLRLCAFLAPDHIPEELITDGAQYWPSLLQQAATNPFAFDQMIESLLGFSLVKRLAENHLLSIHRLVQIVQRDRMDPEEQRQWAERVVTAVNALFPHDPRNEITSWPKCLRYLEQAQACNTLIQELTLELTEGADLLDRTGSYLYEHASYAIAEPLYLRALHIWSQSLGSEHSQTAPPLNGLANIYREQGKYTEAEPLYLHALRIWEQSLGSEHPQLAVPLNGLANIYREQGKYTEAELLYLRAIRIREQSLGPEHSQVAAPLNGLANIYREQGKYTEAELLYLRALRIWSQSLGPEHPQVAYPLNNLANIYREQGKYMEAEPLYLRALHIREQNLGPEHPNMAYPLNNLAELYREQGKYTEAEPLYLRALRIWEPSLGSEHPNMAYPLNNLAELYREQGKYTEAEPLYLRALRIWEPRPQVSYALNGLASLYREQGKHTEAESLFQRALYIREHALEPDHPDIADTLYDFAALREAQGNSEEAVSLYSRALTIREKVYGQKHSKTTDTRERLRAVSTILSQTEGIVALDSIQDLL